MAIIIKCYYQGKENLVTKLSEVFKMVSFKKRLSKGKDKIFLSLFVMLTFLKMRLTQRKQYLVQ